MNTQSESAEKMKIRVKNEWSYLRELAKEMNVRPCVGTNFEVLQFMVKHRPTESSNQQTLDMKKSMEKPNWFQITTSILLTSAGILLLAMAKMKGAF